MGLPIQLDFLQLNLLTDATVEVLLKTPRRGLLGKLIKVIMQLGRLTLNPSGIISNILQQKAKKLRREK